jgi:hypothetical protein
MTLYPITKLDISRDRDQKMSAEDANKRSIADYLEYSQYARASAQFAFAANGGASLAMLSFLTALTTAKDQNNVIQLSVVVHSFAYAATFYLSGLFLSIVAMYVLSLSKQYWGHFWEEIALGETVNFRGPFARRADRLNWIGIGLLILSALAFVPGSAFAVGAFMFR